MTSVALAAEVRNEKGKGGSGRVRARGLCPAVVYGPGAEPLAVAVDPRALLKIVASAGENALIDLEVAGHAEPRKAIVREIQYAPLKPMPLHVDFYLVNLERKIEVSVPLELVGVPVPVAQKSGTLTQTVHELNVACLPMAIPAAIKADVSGLTVGHSLHVRDLEAPAGVEILDAPDLALAAVAGLAAEVEAAPAAAEGGGEPEVLRERKPAAEEKK